MTRRPGLGATAGILLLHTGGLGDLVLFSEAVAALRAAYPRATLTLATRAPVAPFAAASPLGASLDAVVPLPIDPYRWAAPSEALFAALKRTFSVLAHVRTDVLVSAELRPTWLTWALAARLQPRLAFTLRSLEYSRALVDAICERFDLKVPGFRRYADARSQIHELARYERLVRALGVRAPLKIPRWPIPSRRTSALKSRGLAPHSYAVCFPCGAASTPAKRWPPDRFVEVLAGVRHKLGGRVLIVGNTSEQSKLEAFASACRSVGLEAQAFAGGFESFAELRVLIANAWGYLGNDTGLAHLAAVHGVPGLTIYGGGTWPMYAPWAPGSTGVVHPLPCFGCFWDCAFGRGVCVEEIPAADVLAAFEAAVAEPNAPARVLELARVPAPALALIADASRTYRASQADRAARLEALLRVAKN